MATLQRFRRFLVREEPAPATEAATDIAPAALLDVDIAPNDPLVVYFQSAPGVVEVDRLEMDSPGLEALKAAGVKLVVPLVSQGELIGLINLGPRLSEQDYSTDDRKLLFIYFEDGRVGLIVGDVTDKGVPAALVMATTRTLLRAAAERLVSPGQVLERVNELLYPDIPHPVNATIRECGGAYG